MPNSLVFHVVKSPDLDFFQSPFESTTHVCCHQQMTIDTKLIATVATASLVLYSSSFWITRKLLSKTRPTNFANKMTSPFKPSVADVLVVKAMLAQALLAESSRLPPEIVDVIVDLAEYWPHTTAELNDTTMIARGNQPSGRSSGDGEDVFLVCTSHRTSPLLKP